jgi:Glycosyltransferase
MFAFCSRYEGFGLTFLEAMASGTPVIGTPVGGFPDLVTDGESGIIVDRDPTDMTQAIDTLASSPALLEKMSTKARETAESRTWDTVAAETETVYESVIANS